MKYATLIAAACLAEIAGMAAFAGFVAQLPAFTETWRLTSLQAGAIGGAFCGGYALAVPVLATLTDRIGVPASTLVSGRGAPGFALFARGAWSAILFQLLMGIGLAGTYMPGLRLMADRLHGAGQSRAITLYTSSYAVGAGLSFAFVGSLAASLGWRWAFALAAAGPLAVCGAMFCAEAAAHPALFSSPNVMTDKELPMTDALPSAALDHLDIPSLVGLEPAMVSTHPPRILLLYGSVRERSYSRFLTLEAERLLRHFGADTRVFDPRGLPQPDGATPDHPKVRELRDLAMWSEGQVWCSPERHGTITGIFKSQIDWLPLEVGGMRPTQGRTLAVMQVSGGSQSFNTVNTLRVLGRWMRMVTIPNQSSVPKAFQEFDERGRMRPSPLYDRVVDVMEELVKFTLLVRDRSHYLTDRYSERKTLPPQDSVSDLSSIAISHERARRTNRVGL